MDRLDPLRLLRDRYVGWHQNRGLDAAADYYPVAQFSAQRYHPQLVSDTVAYRSENEALGRLQQVNKPSQNASAEALIAKVPQPPQVLNGPPQQVRQAEQTLNVQLGDADDRLIVTLNGWPLQDQRGLQRIDVGANAGA